MFLSCFFPDEETRNQFRAHKISMLKTMRDSLETRLAALNAAIETLERQQQSSVQE
ncbi:hypothetical protein [Halomicronema sp. CCY15110]|uniref:hypothetical protein n=1 Tax=Halomicronema sp. CCY15110 TaxID=2767773 RepID=UPI00194FAA0D|nr:hypothetical protein [Halomicronema sp. CCY15110]